MKHLLYILLLLTIIPAPAFAGEKWKPEPYQGSVAYTIDDGKMDEREIAEEADYIHRLCTGNPFMGQYYDCECIAGAFAIERERVGPFKPNHQLLNRITKSKAPNCANQAYIAGKSYGNCMQESAYARELRNDTEEVCQCVGNKVAKDFAKTPIMDPGYAQAIHSNATIFCDNPSNRPPKKTAQKTQNLKLN